MSRRHPQVERFVERFRDKLARLLSARIATNEATDTKPAIVGLEEGPFNCTGGITAVVEVDGTEYTCTATGASLTAAQAVTDLDAGVTGASWSVDTNGRDGTTAIDRLVLTHDTAASGATSRSIAITGGTGLSVFGFEAGDESAEYAVPDIPRRNIWTFDPFSHGIEPALPALWFSERGTESQGRGSERVYDLPAVLNIWVAHSRPEVAARQVDRIVSAISELIAEDCSCDGAVVFTHIAADGRNPNLGKVDNTTIASATLVFASTFAE